MEGLAQVAAAIHALKEDLDQRHLENVGANAIVEAKVVEAIHGIDELRKAFPDADVDGHRRYHEAVIKRIEARAKLYNELTSHLLKNGLWLGIGFIAYALWQTFKTKVSP